VSRQRGGYSRPEDRLQKRYPVTQAADSEGSLTLLDELLSGTYDGRDRVEALHGKVVSLYRLNRDEEAAAAVAELEGEIVDPSERERALLIAADSIARQREEPALALFDRVIASGHDPVWLQEAYLIKVRCLWNFHRGEEAVGVLSQLASLPPLPSDGGRLVGEGLLLQASILYPHRHQPESAESIYEYVVAASEELRAVQEQAYLQYVGMLEQWRADANRIVELCDQALEVLSRPRDRTWGLLTLAKAKAEYALGSTAEAVATAEQLLRESPDPDVRMFAGEFLEEVGQ